MTLRVRKWEEWQTYRRDRGQPPWIKVHRRLFQNEKWSDLSDEQKGQLVSIWILAADKDGEIPASPKILKKLCLLDTEPDIDAFVAGGWLSQRRQRGVTVASLGRQDDNQLVQSDVPEAEAEAEAEENIQIREEQTPRDVANAKPRPNARGLTVETWVAYAGKPISIRYGTHPVRNASVNGMLSRLVKKAGRQGSATSGRILRHAP